MRTASRRLRQLRLTPQRPIKALTLLLRTGILPIRTVRMTKCLLQLLDQRLRSIQIRQSALRIPAPKDSPMLHARARNALDLSKLCALLFQPLKNKINGFEEERDGCEDLALSRVREHTLLNAMVREVGVEVDFGFVDQFEVRADYNA
jgi:hypothetical protein